MDGKSPAHASPRESAGILTALRAQTGARICPASAGGGCKQHKVLPPVMHLLTEGQVAPVNKASRRRRRLDMRDLSASDFGASPFFA